MALYHPKFEARCLYTLTEVLLYIEYHPSGSESQSVIKKEEDVNILLEHPLQIESAFPKRWIWGDADVHEMLAIFHRYKQELKH